MHVKLEALSDDKLKRTIESNQTLGNIYINLVMAPELMKTEAGIGQLAGLLNKVSTECQAQNMVAGYHCHAFDFAKINGRFAWEILFRQLRPEINMQLDVGNCLSGQGDPIAMFQEFPGRWWSVHIKEYQDKTFDSEFYKEVFHLCETTCATKWYIVEMGGEEGSASRCRARLSSNCNTWAKYEDPQIPALAHRDGNHARPRLTRARRPPVAP